MRAPVRPAVPRPAGARVPIECMRAQSARAHAPDAAQAEVTPNVQFDTIAREWRCKWSADEDKASLVKAQDELTAIIKEVRLLVGSPCALRGRRLVSARESGRPASLLGGAGAPGAFRGAAHRHFTRLLCQRACPLVWALHCVRVRSERALSCRPCTVYVCALRALLCAVTAA